MAAFDKCEHREWIGQPSGVVPLKWRCCDCGMEISAGEMLLLSKLEKFKKLEQLLSQSEPLRYRIAYLLKTHSLLSPDGYYTFPDGETWDALECEAMLDGK